MRISVLCPTRQRPHSVRRMIASAVATADVLPEFVFYVDDDDTVSLDLMAELWPGWSAISPVVGPRITMSDMWNRCAEAATGELLMFVDDEAVFHTAGWDTAIAAVFDRYPDRAVLVHPDDTIHGDVLAAYFFVHRVWLDIFGRLTPPHFSYGYADVWCSEVAQAAGRKVYVPEVVIENMAPKDQPPDHIHRENHERAVRDRPGDLYNATQPDREADVARLLAYVADWRPA